MEKRIVPDGYKDVYIYEFSEKEFNMIFPMISKQLDKKIAALEKKVDYYTGLKEWNATNKQLDKLLEYEEQYDFLQCVKKSIEKTKE